MFPIARLRPLPQREVVKVLETNGFKQVRAGKHLTFKRVDPDGRVWTTWVPHHREVTVFVLMYIIKQTGKRREEFY